MQCKEWRRLALLCCLVWGTCYLTLPKRPDYIDTQKKQKWVPPPSLQVVIFYLGGPHHLGILKQWLTVKSVLPWLSLMAYVYLSFVWLYFLKRKHSNKLRALPIITAPSLCPSASRKNNALPGPWPPAPSPGAIGYESVAGLPGILWDTTCEPQLGTLISQRPESKHCSTFPGNAGAAFKTADNLEVPVFLGG